MNIQWSLNEVEWNELEWMCISNDGITDRFGQDQREWKQHLWMKSNQSNNSYSKLISIEHTRMDDNQTFKVDKHFEDLEYLNTINIQYSEILSNVTERG